MHLLAVLDLPAILDLINYFPDFNMTLEDLVGSNSTEKR